MTPLTSVDKLLPPTVSSFAPNRNEPAPAIEPTVSLLSPAGPVLPEKSTTEAPPVLVMAALPAVLLSKKKTVLLLLMVALPAVLLFFESHVAVDVVGDGGVGGRAGVGEEHVGVVRDGGAAGVAACSLKLRSPPVLLVMVALPAVLMTLKFRTFGVGDGGTLGCAGVEESQGAGVVIDGGVAGPTGVEE